MASLNHRDCFLASGLALLAVLAGFYLMVPGVCGIYHDDAVYVSTAKALAQGEGYRLIDLPDAPIQTKYPILYPALLAVIWKLWPAFPDNLLAMQVLTLLFGAATIGLAYLYLVRFDYFPRGVAAAAALFCITSPLFLFFCNLTLSEIPFAFLTILAMWALDRHLAEPEERRCAAFRLGVLLALPFLTRTIGIVFAPVGLALLYFSRRPLRWVTLGAASLMLPWILWMLLGPRWNENQAASYYTNYLSWFSVFGIFSLGRVVLRNFLYILYNSASVGLRAFNTGPISPETVWPVVLLVGAGLYFNLLKALGKGRVLPCFLVAYLLVVLVWPWPPLRFLVPILPFLLAYLLDWAWNLAKALPFISRPKILGAMGLSILLAFNLAAIYRAGVLSRSMHYPYYERIEEPISWSSYEGLFYWIKAATRASDVLASGLDTMIYLYTDRCGFRPFVAHPASMFYGDNGPPLGSVEEMIGFIKIYQARYFVQLPMPGFREEKPLTEFVDQVQLRYPGWFKTVYRGKDQRFVVFELQPEHEP